MHTSFNTPQIPLRIGTQKISYKYSLQPFWKLFTNSEATSLADQDCTYINKLFIVYAHQCITATYMKTSISFQFPVLRSTSTILKCKNHLSNTQKNKAAGCPILQTKRKSKAITLPKKNPNTQN